MTEIELDGKKVTKLKFHLVRKFLWIEFELEDGRKESSFCMKGTM